MYHTAVQQYANTYSSQEGDTDDWKILLESEDEKENKRKKEAGARQELLKQSAGQVK